MSDSMKHYKIILQNTDTITVLIRAISHAGISTRCIVFSVRRKTIAWTLMRKISNTQPPCWDTLLLFYRATVPCACVHLSDCFPVEGHICNNWRWSQGDWNNHVLLEPQSGCTIFKNIFLLCFFFPLIFPEKQRKHQQLMNWGLTITK